MAHVKAVVMTVHTTDGAHTLVCDQPAPTGDNPAFMGEQLDVAIDELSRRHRALIEAVHGPQIPKEDL